MTISLAGKSKLTALSLLVLPLTTLTCVACDDSEDRPKSSSGGSAQGASSNAGGAGNSEGGMGVAGSAGASAGESGGGAASDGGAAGSGGEGGSGGESGGGEAGSAGESGSGGFGGAEAYEGPSVGRAKTFAALAYSAITTANVSLIGGELGVSAGAVSTIAGFDAPAYKKFGIDSLAPNSQRTLLAQQDVTALVGDIDPRPCDTDLTDVVGGLTNDITLQPGVTCMNSFSADVLLNGHVYLDAGGDPNAFFVIRANMTLTAADAAEVVLTNGAQACGVFWRVSKEITIGKAVKFVGTLVSGTAITMKTGSTLQGRALAQTAGVQLDANSVQIPTACTHVE